MTGNGKDAASQIQLSNILSRSKKKNYCPNKRRLTERGPTKKCRKFYREINALSNVAK
jgi:hypothetical protein